MRTYFEDDNNTGCVDEFAVNVIKLSTLIQSLFVLRQFFLS